MRNHYYFLLFLPLLYFFVCCKDNSVDVLLHHMDYIMQKGDSESEETLEELCSMENDIKACRSDYIHYKYLLLKIRLQDKSGILPNSPDTIESVVNYFVSHGNYDEQMEAYYYQGSVYRDLNDYPRSLTSFNKVLDIAGKNNAGMCVLLQNTYSQLSWLYTKQQIYSEALKMAEAGCDMAENTNSLDPIYLMDVATSAFLTNDTALALKYSRKTLEYLKSDSTGTYSDVTCELLRHFVECKMKEEIDTCLSILKKSSDSEPPFNYLGTMASYYESISMMDSAVYYNKMIISGAANFSQKMEAANCLMDYYIQEGSNKDALYFASLYSQFVDSVFIENQYEQVSRACGEHLYSISLEKELQARKEAESSRNRFYGIIVFCVFVVLIASFIYAQKKRYYINKLLMKESELGNANDVIKKNDKLLAENKALINKQKLLLSAIESELRMTETEMANKIAEKERIINEQENKILALNNTIAKNESVICEKHKQIGELVRLSLLEKANIEAANILEKFRDASFGKEHLKNTDWQSLYVAVEEMYPGFREAVMSMPRGSELGVKTAYLLKIGLSNSQIANLTNCSRTTVWDRVKKIRGCLGVLLDPIS